MAILTWQKSRQNLHRMGLKFTADDTQRHHWIVPTEVLWGSFSYTQHHRGLGGWYIYSSSFDSRRICCQKKSTLHCQTAKPTKFPNPGFFFGILELLAQLGYIGPNAPCESRAILLNIEEQTNHTQTTKCALDKPLIMQRCGWDKVNKLDGKNPRPTPAFWAQFFEF